MVCRGKSNQYTHTSLLKVDGVNTREEVDFYLGKRVAFIYRASTRKQGTTFRCIWGKVRSTPTKLDTHHSSLNSYALLLPAYLRLASPP